MIGRRVKGEGPPNAKIMVIGEYAGRAEAISGRPFSGAAGKEIDRFFDGVRLPTRYECFLTNWIREWPGEDVDFTQADFDRDEPALIDEIRQLQPEVIVCLGRHITRYFLGDVDLEDTHSLPWRVFLCPEGKPIRSTCSLLALFNEHQDAGSGKEQKRPPVMGNSPSKDVPSQHIDTPTSTSSSRSQQKLSIICAETKSASTQPISTRLVTLRMLDGTTRSKHIAVSDIHSLAKTCTCLQANHNSECVESARQHETRLTPDASMQLNGHETNAHAIELREVVAFAAYNPAAGFRSPELSSAVAYDFAQLEAFLNGDLHARILYDDPHPNPDYIEIDDIATLDDVMTGDVFAHRMPADPQLVFEFAADTEGLPHAPWSIQISSTPGVAWIVRQKRKELIERFAWYVNKYPDRYLFTFHAALHDLGMFRVFGIDVRRLQFDDTSIMSYNLQLEPPGLKPLCVRWNGMSMQSFDDIMGDVSTQIAQDWLLSCTGVEEVELHERCQVEFDRLRTTPYVDARGKVKPGRKLRKLPKLPKADLHKALERSLRSKTPRKLWANQTIDHHVAAKPKYGTMWEATLDHVEPEKALFYAGRDADGTGRLKPKLWERVVANNLEDIYRADLGTVLLIDRMQQIGIKPDLAHFKKLGDDLETELIEIRATLAEQLVAAGAFDLDSAFQFNANSTYQVGDLLYKHFSLPILKETRDGDPSTNDKILEALEKAPDTPKPARKIISDIRYFRETYKLKYTFVDEIPAYVNRWPFDGRIHASFRITRIPTGRLAASDPNLLAMPKYGKFAGRFREGFVSGHGKVLGSWDLSQIELRVLAHLSQDPVLLDAYISGLDLHAILAQRLFGGTVAQYALKEYGEQRRNAKVINFMIPMGCTAVGLCLELKKNGTDVTEDDAQRWLDETMALYKHVPLFQQEKIAEARRLGYVTDIRGRRFYLGGIRSSHKATRSESERQAGALPIQASAQEVMKVAEAAVWAMIVRRQDAGQWIEPILQIHDDLIPEMDDRIVYQVNRDMINAMTKVPAHMLTVPIETSGDYGRCWGEMHDIEKHKGDPSFNHVDGCDACEKIKKQKAKKAA